MNDSSEKVIDSFSYAAHPEGERFLFGFLGGAALLFLLILWSRLSLAGAICYVVLTTSLLGFRFSTMLRQRSELTLDSYGIRRGSASRPWLSIPWDAIEKVCVRKSFIANSTGLLSVFDLYPKASQSVPGFSKRVKILGTMVRREAFGTTFLSCLRERGIQVIET
jgi:hypothetical protein